jgi:hypothetical protein
VQLCLGKFGRVGCWQDFLKICGQFEPDRTETCYKAFRLEVPKQIHVGENRFGFGPEITAKVSRLNMRIYEVPISYFGRTYAEGKNQLARWHQRNALHREI